MTTDTQKQMILCVLRAFIGQRPGLEFGNYCSGWQDSAGRAAYRSEMRSITKDLHHARELLRAVELSSISGEQLAAAFDNAYSGRLKLIQETSDGAHVDRYGLDYCTGQYFPTEYRKAAAAVCASALWNYYREDFVDGYKSRATVTTDAYGSERYNGKSPGDIIRENFRRMFGRTIAARYFN